MRVSRWLIFAGCLLVAGCEKGPAAGAKARPPPLVKTARVVAEDVPVRLSAPIDLRPVAQADLGAKTVGYLDAVLVDRGDLVKKGQVLALMRPSDLPDQLTAAKSALAQAEASASLAAANLERAKQLAPRGLVSQQDLQNASTQAATAEAQRGAAKSQLAALGVRFGETRLEAPYDGVVTQRKLDPGALIGPATGPVLTVARVDTLRAFIAVNERRASEVALGQRAVVSFDAVPGRTFTGRVQRLAPSFDLATRTLDAEVHLPNDAGVLRPGMYGRGAIELGLHPAMPVIPVEAIQRSNDRAFVFVLDGDVVHRKPVTLGEELDERFEVTSGLVAGDEIVVLGIDGLAEGSRVRRPSAPADGGR